MIIAIVLYDTEYKSAIRHYSFYRLVLIVSGKYCCGACSGTIGNPIAVKSGYFTPVAIYTIIVRFFREAGICGVHEVVACCTCEILRAADGLTFFVTIPCFLTFPILTVVSVGGEFVGTVGNVC